MTTDPTPLQESIARALTEHWKRKHSTLLTSGPCSGCSRVAADAVTAEVRKAQADAWDEGQAFGWGNAREESDQHGGVCDMWKPHVWLTPNPYREQED